LNRFLELLTLQKWHLCWSLSCGDHIARNEERVAQYHVDVPDDEKMDVMCIFLSTWSTFDSVGFLFCVTSLLPRFSEFISIGVRLQELQRDTLLLQP